MSQGASNVAAATSVATGLLATAVATSETAVFNTLPQSAVFEELGGQSQGLRIRGLVNVTAGATGTGFTVKLRQGASTTSGAQVGPSVTHTTANSASAQIAFDFLDTSPVSGNQVYTLTLTAATAAGTLNSAVIGVEVGDQYETGAF